MVRQQRRRREGVERDGKEVVVDWVVAVIGCDLVVVVLGEKAAEEEVRGGRVEEGERVEEVATPPVGTIVEVVEDDQCCRTDRLDPTIASGCPCSAVRCRNAVLADPTLFLRRRVGCDRRDANPRPRLFALVDTRWNGSHAPCSRHHCPIDDPRRHACAPRSLASPIGSVAREGAVSSRYHRSRAETESLAGAA